MAKVKAFADKQTDRPNRVCPPTYPWKGIKKLLKRQTFLLLTSIFCFHTFSTLVKINSINSNHINLISANAFNVTFISSAADQDHSIHPQLNSESALNPIPNDKIIDQSKLKNLPKTNKSELKFGFERVENIV